MLIVGSKNTWGKYLVRMIKALLGVPFDFIQQQHVRIFKTESFHFYQQLFLITFTTCVHFLFGKLVIFKIKFALI
jgi:hypothetical protein